MTTNENGHKRLAKCKNGVQRIAAFYPLDQSGHNFDFVIDTSRYLSDVNVYNAIHTKVSKKGKIRVNHEWVEPILWCTNKFQWSQECKEEDEINCKRGRSCTFVELTYAIEILTEVCAAPGMPV